jgi:hypothetical protein
LESKVLESKFLESKFLESKVLEAFMLERLLGRFMKPETLQEHNVSNTKKISVVVDNNQRPSRFL